MWETEKEKRQTWTKKFRSLTVRKLQMFSFNSLSACEIYFLFGPIWLQKKLAQKSNLYSNLKKNLEMWSEPFHTIKTRYFIIIKIYQSLLCPHVWLHHILLCLLKWSILMNSIWTMSTVKLGYNDSVNKTW